MNKTITKATDNPKTSYAKQNNENKNQSKKENETESINEKIIDKNKYIFELVNMWISNADNKINIAFAMLSALVAAVVFITDNLLSDMVIDQNANKCYLNWFYFFAVIAAVCFCFSVFFYVMSIIPRLTSDKALLKKLKKEKKDKEEKEPKYSIFYDEIKDFSKAEDFVNCANKANDSMFNEELLKEIYYNSGICSKKMLWFRKGAIASFLTIFLSMAAALLYFLYAVGFQNYFGRE